MNLEKKIYFQWHFEEKKKSRTYNVHDLHWKMHFSSEIKLKRFFFIAPNNSMIYFKYFMMTLNFKNKIEIDFQFLAFILIIRRVDTICHLRK